MLCTNLWEIPVIQSNNRSDLVLQQIVNQIIIVLYSFFIYMVSCKRCQDIHSASRFNIFVGSHPLQLSVTHT